LAAATLLDLPSGISAWRNIPDLREAFDNGPFSPERGQSPTAVLTTRCQTIVSHTLTYFLMGRSRLTFSTTLQKWPAPNLV
jgi:hypothetical protein